MYKRKIPIELNCGLDLVKEVLYGKWKVHLIYFISQGLKRPSELQRKIPRATRRVLNVQLNQLEDDHQEQLRSRIAKDRISSSAQ